MAFISKSIFEDILPSVLENRFPEIEQLSNPQNEALFGILNCEDVFAILPTGHGKSIIFQCLPDLCRELFLRGFSYPRNAIVVVVCPLKCLWNEMKKLPKIILWYWWLCFDCKFFHRTFTFLLRPSQRHMIMGDISSRGHFDLMTSQGLQVSRQCKNKQWK